MPSLNSVLRRPFDGDPEEVPLTALQRAVVQREDARKGKGREAAAPRPARRRWRLEPVEIAAAGRVSYPSERPASAARAPRDPFARDGSRAPRRPGDTRRRASHDGITRPARHAPSQPGDGAGAEASRYKLATASSEASTAARERRRRCGSDERSPAAAPRAARDSAYSPRVSVPAAAPPTTKPAKRPPPKKPRDSLTRE